MKQAGGGEWERRTVACNGADQMNSVTSSGDDTLQLHLVTDFQAGDQVNLHYYVAGTGSTTYQFNSNEKGDTRLTIVLLKAHMI